jgi:hypothetical protein
VTAAAAWEGADSDWTLRGSVDIRLWVVEQSGGRQGGDIGERAPGEAIVRSMGVASS